MIKVMIVDDHPMVAEGIQSILESYDDIEVVGCLPNGRAAIDSVAQLAPDVVLMDLNMPDQLGTDVLAQIRSTPQLAKMPVVMQSASEREADVRASRAAGANAYFVKPITARDIPAVMGHIQDPIPKR